MNAQTAPRDSDCPVGVHGHPSALPMAEPTARGSQRRRLWQLPTQAHELLLAMSFTPEWLRRETARTLGQIHKGRCLLNGRDVNVLYSAVHDLVTRNPLSKTLHKHLEARNAPAVRAMAAAKDEPALQAAWARARDDERSPTAVPASFLGRADPSAGRDRAIGRAVRRPRLGAHARRSVGQTMAQQQHAAETLRLAQAEIARLQGELARQPIPAQANKVPEAAVHRDKSCEALVRVDVPEKHAADRTPAVVEAPRPAATPASAPGVTLTTASATAPTRAACPGPALPPPLTVDVAGRRVLCVGGIQHATPMATQPETDNDAHPLSGRPATRTPTACEYRRQAALREQWRTAAAMAAVVALAVLVFWLLPVLPAAAAMTH